VALLALIAVASCASDYETLFVSWITQHNKVYAHDEFQNRFQIFRKNAMYIESFNKKNLSFSLAINQFADLTTEEFNKLTKGLRPIERLSSDAKTPVQPNVPASWDWRTKNAVVQIKNQGQCGSCWAFSTTGSVEGSRAINTGQLISLSEQQLVDCSGSYGNQGCRGGLMDNAFQYIIANGGLDSEDSYPYTAQDGSCQYNPATCATTISGYKDVNAGDENDLLNSVYNIGPVSVAIDASHSSFQFYSGGVYYEPSCSASQLDHGVLAIGYGTDSASGSDYWIVKNSWGTSWGMSGFIWMSRNKNNNCGIATAASYPIGGSACKRV